MQIAIAGSEVAVDGGSIRQPEEVVRRQLQEYCDGRREVFELTVQFPDGFLGEVMRALQEIPYGEVRTYGEVAERLDTAAVAVGQACARNPVPIIVPCHRVVAVDGLGGYQYPGVKEELLTLEGAIGDGNRVHRDR